MKIEEKMPDENDIQGVFCIGTMMCSFLIAGVAAYTVQCKWEFHMAGSLYFLWLIPPWCPYHPLYSQDFSRFFKLKMNIGILV